ncbi:protein required for normal CLN1 and CLN2 G1 cyclin expression [Coemansia sp. S16]|nr:protein required for normal CLN1 and CLN2 G1 cyclin expression [Coemansia sp. S16]KAJ2353192.1 protein required for normal CLN1 and CLN2 G1 cyclin expression [Coemansia sp. RSA 2673]
MATLEPRVIEVPIDNSNDVLEIDCSQLPEHAAEICDILENEGSALRFYQLFALEYYKQGHVEEAVVALKRGMANAKANDQTAKVPLLNLLASIYVQKAKSATVTAAPSDRDIMLKMATALLTEAERIDRTEPNTHLVGGMLDLAKRLPDAALQHFDAALKTAPRSAAALLGKARVLFGKHRYQHALEVYQQVLVLRPTGRPDPRIGVGLCLHKLGHAADARRALARAAEVDPTAAAPHILLATMDLNDVKRMLDPRIAEAPITEATTQSVGEVLHSAMAHLHRAFERQPDCAATLIRLADRMFFQSNYDAARGLAERALKSADTMAIQAEAHYQIARAYHAAKRFDLAYDAYQKCLASNDKHSLARYGLGQMQLHRTDMSSAEATFQRVLDHHPKCVEVLRALGYLHARLPNTKAKALEYYEREMQVLADEATEHAKRHSQPTDDITGWFGDANLFLEAGSLYEASNAKKARKAYSMAADILQRPSATTDSVGDAIPELWNNLGALSQLTGDDDAAIFSEYNQAARKCTSALADARLRLTDMRKGAAPAAAASKAASEVQRLENTLATITYNVARFYEHCGFWDKAEALYTSLLADIPTYIDARLRLAHIAFFFRGNAEEALEHISKAVGIDSKRSTAWLMRGNIELHRKSVQDARRAFEHVLKDIAKHDIYALCSLGNYYLAAGKSDHSRAASEANPASASAKKLRDMSTQNYKRALEFFDKCLLLDERCAAAAHGTAIAMAERGHANDARQVFQDVRDAATAGLGPLTLCTPASELVFKIAKHQQAQSTALDGTAPPMLAESSVGCDVLLWSGINVAHSYIEVGNYRQAVLAYEASLRRLQEATKAMETADMSPAASSQFVVSALEAKCGAETEDSNSVKPPTATRLTAAERAERKRVERDLRLYLIRALYIQAKATKDIEIMRAALDHARSLCADENINLPESALKPDTSAADSDAAIETAADGGDEPKDADSDIEMADEVAEPVAEPVVAETTAVNGSEKKPLPVRLSPEDCLVLYDLALVEQSVAQLVSEQPESQRTLQDLTAAATYIAHSTAAFTFLASWGKIMQKKRQKLLFSARLATERANYSRALVAKLTRKQQEQEAFERQRQEHVEQWRKQQEEDEKNKRDEAEAAIKAQQEAEKKMLRDAEERNAILREQMAASSKQDDADMPSGRSKKSKARAAPDGFISDNDDLAASDDGAGSDSAAGTARHQKSKKAKQLTRKPAGEPRNRVRAKPSGGHTEDDPEGSTPPPRKRRNVADEEEVAAHTESSKYKSKAIITDSDDDDSA